MRTIYRDIVAALIISKDNKIFMGMKDPANGGVYSHCWHIPGGGMEEGETKQNAVIREILEETGIDISNYKLELISYDGQGESIKTLKTGEQVICKMKFFTYRILLNDKELEDIKVQLSSDLIKYEWINIDKLENYKLTPPSIELFTKLGYLK